MDDTTNHIMTTTIKAAPPVAVGVLHHLAVQLPDWITILSFVYIVLQIYIALKHLREGPPK
jgi:uncharacterized protein involved in cysteine biosynthesis